MFNNFDDFPYFHYVVPMKSFPLSFILLTKENLLILNGLEINVAYLKGNMKKL